MRPALCELVGPAYIVRFMGVACIFGVCMRAHSVMDFYTCYEFLVNFYMGGPLKVGMYGIGSEPPTLHHVSIECIIQRYSNLNN